jgi:hypothetical protein
MFLACIGAHKAYAASVQGAVSRTYPTRPNVTALPTGCVIGEAPQYQAFTPSLGRAIVQNGKVLRTDFNPVAVCRRAAALCSTFVSGQSCCTNACRQQHSDVRKNLDESAFVKCTVRCARVPTFSKVKIGQLEKSVKFVPGLAP